MFWDIQITTEFLMSFIASRLYFFYSDSTELTGDLAEIRGLWVSATSSLEALLFEGFVIVSGKLRAQRAMSMKFKGGYMISSGHPVKARVVWSLKV